jgi:RsmE family RNA methyltransferase
MSGIRLLVYSLVKVPTIIAFVNRTVVGPEGGFTEDELHMLESCPNVEFISLGLNILRAETAGIAALSCAMATQELIISS